MYFLFINIHKGYAENYRRPLVPEVLFMSQKVYIENTDQLSILLSTVVGNIRETSQLGEESEYYVRVVYSELILNALKYSTGHSVVLLYSVSGAKLRSCIIDAGEGFDPQKHLQNCPEIDAERGRGIFLANNLCKQLRYNKKGDRAYFEIELVNNA